MPGQHDLQRLIGVQRAVGRMDCLRIKVHLRSLTRRAALAFDMHRREVEIPAEAYQKPTLTAQRLTTTTGDDGSAARPRRGARGGPHE